MTISLLLLAHWVGDFAFQTSNMALNKSHSMKWLMIHVAAYSSAILLFSLFLMPVSDLVLYVAVNAVLHLVTDFFTSRWAHKYKRVPRKFFPIIGIDQLIHTLSLYWTLILLKSELYWPV